MCALSFLILFLQLYFIFNKISDLKRNAGALRYDFLAISSVVVENSKQLKEINQRVCLLDGNNSAQECYR